MLTYEFVRELCKKNHVTVTQLEIDCGFSKGSLCRMNKSQPSADRVQKIADYFNVPVDFLIAGDITQIDLFNMARDAVDFQDGYYVNKEGYYLNPETAEVAQEIFENKELRLLFDAAKDASPEDLQTVHQMLIALKRKEKGDVL